jgi:hypothetical protein
MEVTAHPIHQSISPALNFNELIFETIVAGVRVLSGYTYDCIELILITKCAESLITLASTFPIEQLHHMVHRKTMMGISEFPNETTRP